MRSTTIVFVAFCLFAGAMAELAYTAEQEKCFEDATLACDKNSVSSCQTEYRAWRTCITSNCISASDLSAYGACMAETCKSSHKDVQAYSEANRTCIYSSVLGLSVALIAILVSLF